MIRVSALLLIIMFSLSALAQPANKWQPILQQAKADSSKGSWTKAIENYKKGIALINQEKSTYNVLAAAQHSLANIFCLQVNKPDSAVKYYYQALTYFDSAQNKKEFVKVLNALKNNLYENTKYESYLFQYPWLTKEEQTVFVPLQNVQKISDSLAEFFIYLGEQSGLVSGKQGVVKLAAKADTYYVDEIDVAYFNLDEVLANETYGRILAVDTENLDSLIKEPLYLVTYLNLPQHNYESIFYKNFLNGSYLKNNYVEQLLPFQIAVTYSSPFLESVMADSLTRECLVFSDVIKDMEDSVYKIKITEGKFKGQDLKTAFKNIKPVKIENFFDYLSGNSQKFSGYDGYLAEALAIWMFKTPKGPLALLDSMLLLNDNNTALNNFQKRNQHLFNTDFYNVIRRQALLSYKNKNFEKALKINDALISLSEAGTDTFKIADAYFNRAYILAKPNTEKLSNEWYRKAKKYFNLINDTANILIVNQNMVVNYNAVKDYLNAGNSLDENLKLRLFVYDNYRDETSKHNLVNAYLEKASNLSLLNNTEEMMEIFLKALKISPVEKDSILIIEEIVNKCYEHHIYSKQVNWSAYLVNKFLENKEAIKAANVLIKMGFAYSNLNLDDESLKSYITAGNLYNQEKDYFNYAFSLSNIGQIYWTKYEKDSAILYHHKAIDLRRNIKDTAGIAYSYSKLGTLYKENGLLEKSNESFVLAEKLFVQLPESKEFADLLKDRANNYYAVKDFDKALIYYERAGKVYAHLKLDESAEITSINIANLKLFSGKVSEAEQLLNNIKNAHKENPNYDNYINVNFILSSLEKSYKNNRKAAIDLLKETLNTAINYKDTASLSLILNEIGNYYLEFDETDSTKFYLTQAESLLTDKSDLNALLNLNRNWGYFYSNIGEIDSAVYYYKKQIEVAKKMKNLTEIASAEMNLSSIDIMQGNYDAALKAQYDILKIYLKNEESFGVANIYMNIGNILNRQTQFDEAVKYYNKSDSLFSKFNNVGLRLNPLNNAGSIYYQQGNLIKAEEMYNKVMELMKNYESPSMLRIILVNLGEIYIENNKYPQAKQYLDSCIKLSIKAKDQHSKFISEWLLGKLEWKNGNFDKALTLIRTAKAGCLAYGDNFYNSAIENELANVYFDLKNYDSASYHWNQGIKYTKLIKSETYLWKHYSGLAKIALQKNDNQTARLYLDSAINVVEAIKLRVSGGDEARKIFGSGESVLELYQKMATVLKNMGRNEEALLYLEKSNVENINSRLAADNKSTKEDEIALAKKQKLVSIEKETTKELEKPAARQNTEALARLTEMKTVAENDYLNFIGALAKKYPGRTDLQLVNAREFKKERAYIPDDVALLSYLITPNELSIFVVTKDSLLIKDIPVNKQLLENKIKEYYAALSKNSSTAMRGNVKIGKKETSAIPVDTLAVELYNILVEPAITSLNKQTKIAIIPSGFLSFVPFQALGKPVNNAMQYFGNDKEVFYVNRITNVTNNRAEALNGLRIIAVGNTDNSLPYAEAEVKGLMEQYPKSVSFIKSAATKKNVLGQTGDYNILHLATHGILDYNHADSSYLLLAKDPLNKDDGKLHINDIYRIENIDRFKLVTLSACETAVVKDLVDGWPISTAAAFLEAGVSTVVASLWQVDDKATGLLMQEFYKNMQTMSKVEALQKAQQYIQKMPDYSHPYYWAAFQVVGLWK